MRPRAIPPSPDSLKIGFPEFRAWASHSAVLDTYRAFFRVIRVHFAQKKASRSFAELESSQLERKIRLLAFSSLASDHIGRDLPDLTIESTLQIDTSQVEKWTIDGKTNQLPQRICLHGCVIYISHSNRGLNLRLQLIEGLPDGNLKASRDLRAITITKFSDFEFKWPEAVLAPYMAIAIPYI